MRPIDIHLRTAACLAGLLLLVVACNMGTSENAPPTLAPLPTLPPQATLGYAAPGPVTVGEIGPTPEEPPVDVMGELLAQVESDRLMQHVRSLQEFQTRHIASTQDSRIEGIGAARRYIQDQLQLFSGASGGNLYTFDLRFDAYITPDELTPQYNVVGAIGGSEVNGGTILVGAHYDSIGLDRTSGSAYAPGANDNASGVAAVLEMARILSASKYKATVMFALFSAEEIDRQGSRAFAAWIKQSNIDLVGMINLDTIGNVHDFAGLVNDQQLRVFSAPPNSTSPSRKLARTANFLAYNYEMDMALQVQDAIDRENRWGDHFSFSELGYPAVRFINAHEEKRNADPTDTIEFIEPGYLRRATQASLAVLLSLADGPRPPANIALRNRDESWQELVWEPVAAKRYIIALRPPGSLIYAQQIQFDETKLSWDGFADYEAIAIAAIDDRGLIGPLSAEINPRQTSS
ncbi:MAG: M20/M25/M40 family metallo-hydrolase [Chloroflexi bacterium]|nr:M20/M25/M40 family metallo-hydrolase [Chloroflexota bacterium]MCY4248640.1 M20/M25/M40 family metallo-hydrolase [Chloroflexota bacterium]